LEQTTLKSSALRRNLLRMGPFLRWGAAERTLIEETKERQMNPKRIILAGCAATVLGIGTALAGPCNTTGQADAGAGPTVGSTGQTTGVARPDANQHPPTSTMNQASGTTATSSQDAQRQMQGQPTAAQQAQGATSTSEKMADQGC
jgi:hypothetical protein